LLAGDKESRQHVPLPFEAGPPSATISQAIHPAGNGRHVRPRRIPDLRASPDRSNRDVADSNARREFLTTPAHHRGPPAGADLDAAVGGRRPCPAVSIEVPTKVRERPPLVHDRGRMAVEGLSGSHPAVNQTLPENLRVESEFHSLALGAVAPRRSSP